MSSLAIDPASLPIRRLRRRADEVLADHGPDVMLGVVVAALAIALLVQIPHDYNVDSWLELVVGREVWHSGIPHENLLTFTGYGHRWIDEQWLSQLTSYGIFRLGGLWLLGVVNAALVLGPIAAAITIARRRGAPFRSVVLALPLCVALTAPWFEIRTQEFAMGPFLATMWLLSSDSREGARTRRVYWCLPILALWANLHGSVTLGAGLVVLYAFTLLWSRRARLRSEARAWRRPALLACGAVAAILLTPYGLEIVGYYRSTIVDSDLRNYVSEWRPITTNTPLTLAWLLLVALAVWSFGRAPTRTTTWEKLALLLVAVGALDVMRNALFLGLLALLVLPVSLGERASPGTRSALDAERSRRINGACAALVTIGLVGALAATLLAPASSIIDAHQSPGLLAAVRRATTNDPRLRVIADDHYSDFLLWEDPNLAGRMAADVRFELLDWRQLVALSDVFQDSGPQPLGFARGDRLVVLNRAADPAGIAALLAQPGRRILYHDASSLVVLRGAQAAARP